MYGSLQVQTIVRGLFPQRSNIQWKPATRNLLWLPLSRKLSSEGWEFSKAIPGLKAR